MPAVGPLISVAYAEPRQVITFDIRRIVVEGNTLLSDEQISKVVDEFTGPDKTALEVEKAREELEGLYRKEGYPAVLVNIPEQTVDEGIIRLQVIESRIGEVRVTGNRYFTLENILKDLSSFRPGKILHIPSVQADLNKINSNPDLNVSPVLMAGMEPGTTDVELKVKDQLPLHASIELSNRSSHDTTDLRLNTIIGYHNLWQKKHSISLQYQTSPEKTEEVQVVAASYVFPTPWNDKNLLAMYGIWSDSETAFGEGFQVVGKGNIFGARYVVPLPVYKTYAHNITIGIDYKDFEETLGFENEEEGTKTPITYIPLSFSYTSSLPDSTGFTQFSAGANMALRGAKTDQREFEIKRYKSRGNYLYVTAGIERTQKLPAGMGLFLKLDGQIADQPLISNEQYSAGGMESVRGYKESEELGDNAIHGTIELLAPDLAGIFDLQGKFSFTPYLFYDAAELTIKDPLPGEDRSAVIKGAGAGVRGHVTRYIEYGFDWAMALADTDRTEKGDTLVYFRVKCAF
jgi:hemolysin activation/secretion protein